MPFLPGTRRGLDACASTRGTVGVLALDHRQNVRREFRHDALAPRESWYRGY